MGDQGPTQVIVSTPEVTWSVKEVFSDLKSDIIKRFDSQDKALLDIDRRLDSTATKEDVHSVRNDMVTGFKDIHERIDKAESRITPLEQQASDERAVEENRGRWRGSLAWAAGILASLAIAAALVVPFLTGH